MSVFARQQATAQKLIKKNGIAGVLRRTSPATPDPLKPWIQLPSTTIEFPVFVVVFPFDESRSSQKTRSWAKKNPDMITGICEALMSSTTVVPQMHDFLIVGNRKFTVLDFDDLSPNIVEKILYTLTLKE